MTTPFKRAFYAETCRAERGSTRTLERKIGTVLFERTAVGKKPAEVIGQDPTALRDGDRVTPGLVFREASFADMLDTLRCRGVGKEVSSMGLPGPEQNRRQTTHPRGKHAS